MVFDKGIGRPSGADDGFKTCASATARIQQRPRLEADRGNGGSTAPLRALDLEPSRRGDVQGPHTVGRVDGPPPRDIVAQPAAARGGAARCCSRASRARCRQAHARRRIGVAPPRDPRTPTPRNVAQAFGPATSPAARSSGRTSACSIPARRTISHRTLPPVRTCRDDSTSDRRPVGGPRRPAEGRPPAARK